MRQYLSKIRAEAAALYAAAHPEVRLEDIGTALGYAKGHAAVGMVSVALKRLGGKRKHGAGSAAFDLQAQVDRQTKHDWAVIADYVKQNPSMNYREVGRHFGCDPSTVSDAAKRAGIFIGRHSPETSRRISEGKKIKTDAEIREYFSVPRPGKLREHAEALGYTEKGLSNARTRLGITRS